MQNKHSKNNGYLLVETIVYSLLLTVLVAVIAYSANAILVASRTLKATRQVENSAIAALDRIVREIRAAQDYDAINSSLGVSDGSLTLTIPVSGGGTRTAKFYISGQKVMVADNGVVTGPLSLSNTRVTSLKFFALSTTTSKAIKVELTILGPTSTPDIVDKFYATAVMRSAYQG